MIDTIITIENKLIAFNIFLYDKNAINYWNNDLFLWVYPIDYDLMNHFIIDIINLIMIL